MTELDYSAAGTERAVAAAQAANSGTLMERLQIRWLEVTPDRVVATMPVQGNTQIYDVLHGGATAALCETVASLGTAMIVGKDVLALGVQLSINHVRAVREGSVVATGTPAHIGRTTAVWDIRVEDEERNLVALSRLTLVLRTP
jgi:uncharacterized protein (TIGR00369 family)